jgi:hypothetical protein
MALSNGEDVALASNSQFISGTDIANGLLKRHNYDAGKNLPPPPIHPTTATPQCPQPPGPSLIDLFDRTRYYPIAKTLSTYLSIAEIIPLTRTCRALAPLYQTFLQRHWKITPHLTRFVRAPYAFRSKLSAHNALISGSVALQFFMRVSWPDSDMDVYVQRGEDADALETYLFTAEGYELDTTRAGDNYSMPLVAETRTYIRRKGLNNEPNTGHPPRIQLVLTWFPPLRILFTDFSTTLCVNFLTAHAAYSVFPSPTFLHNVSYPLKALTPEIACFLPKYEDRGWKIKRWMPEEPVPGVSFLNRRSIGDRYTWIIGLEGEGGEREVRRDKKVEEAMFQLAGYKSHFEIVGLLTSM